MPCDDVFPLRPLSRTVHKVYGPDPVAARDRVIARLLDGWQPYPNGRAPERWVLRGNSATTDSWRSMSDGEAAIIRAHQEKTQ